MRVRAVYSWTLRGIFGASSSWTTDAFSVFSAFLKKIARRTVFRTEQLYARYCRTMNIAMRLSDAAATQQLSPVSCPTRRVAPMEDLTADVLGEWESEGGATIAHFATPGLGQSIAAKTILVGTPNQIEWAEQIRDRVHKEFDRVGMILNSVAAKQVGWDQTDTLKLAAILEEKRNDVMANDRAGYFIHDWQELRDQVREMIVKDPRHGKIMARQAARKHVM